MVSIKYSNLKKHTLLLLLSASFSFFLLKDNFSAKFGMIDDHQIINSLGSDLKLNYYELPPLLYNNVVSTYGTFIRQVPTYLVLRSLEIFLWGNNPFFWYLARYFYLSSAMYILLFVLSRHTKIVFAFIFTMFIMSGDYWSGILTRLGTHEIYVLPGLALYFLGLTNILESQKKTNQIKNWIFILIGTIISSGSKENLVVLVIPTIFLYVYSIKKKLIGITETLIFSLSTLFCILITIGVIIMLKKTGHDVYANDISIYGRSQLLINGIVGGFIAMRAKYFLLIGAIIFILSKQILPSNKHIEISKTIIKYLLIIASFIFVYASQYSFYSGLWPTGMRYDFPGLLVIPFFWLTMYFFLKKTLSHFKQGRILTDILSLSFFGTLLFIVFQNKYQLLRDASSVNAKETITFNSKINRIVEYSNKNPTFPIVFHSYNPYDYEGIASTNKYISIFGSKNTKYLLVHDSYTETNKELAKILTEKMTDVSLNGGKGEFDFRPKNLYTQVSDNCISISFTKQNVDSCIFKEIIP